MIPTSAGPAKLRKIRRIRQQESTLVLKDKQNNKSPAPLVDSLATALSLLNYFTIKEPELSLSELSEKSGLYKSRIHRLCATLVAMDFLIRTPSSTYRLGPKLMALGKIYENTNDLVMISRPIMKRLAEDAGESVALFQLDGETSFCLSREYGSSSLVFTIQEGDGMELHASAAGRVLLTYGAEELREKILRQTKFEKFTSETITDPEKIKKELDRIRKRGYAINRGERELEVAAIAAPIFDHDDNVYSALAIVGPVQRFSSDREDTIAKSLLQATSRISELLGASVR